MSDGTRTRLRSFSAVALARASSKPSTQPAKPGTLGPVTRGPSPEPDDLFEPIAQQPNEGVRKKGLRDLGAAAQELLARVGVTGDYIDQVHDLTLELGHFASLDSVTRGLFVTVDELVRVTPQDAAEFGIVERIATMAKSLAPPEK